MNKLTNNKMWIIHNNMSIKDNNNLNQKKHCFFIFHFYGHSSSLRRSEPKVGMLLDLYNSKIRAHHADSMT